jgi:uncharacterized membrane protein YeaQ/YmgE (transglycosylase-associated protein family)
MLKRFLDNARPCFAPAPAGLAILLLAAVPALAGGYVSGSTHTFVDSIIEWIGVADMDDEAVDVFGAALLVFAAFFGYFSNLAMKEHGFGIVLNGLIGVAGICVVLHFALPRLPLLRGVSEEMRFTLGLIVAATGAPLFLVAAALFMKAATRRVNRVLIRVGTPPRPQPIGREPQFNPRIAAAVRRKGGG